MFTLGTLSAILGIMLLLALPLGFFSPAIQDVAEGIGLLAIGVATGSAGVALIRIAKDL